MIKGTVMIAEDRGEFRKIYGDRLRAGGYVVVEAPDGEAALALLKEQPVDLVITDINMPKRDGYELIADMQADSALKAIPIIVMSVMDQGEHIEKAMSLGASDYLVKGMATPNAVTEKVAALLQSA